MKRKKLLFIFGTRPEAIKLAPLVLQLNRYAKYFKSVIVSTGQHNEMLGQVLKTFKIKPHYDLEIMQKNQSLAKVLSSAVAGLEKIVEHEKPDMVIVQGDTATTFAGALVAFYHCCPVAHVEAGLRTFDKWKPYPEEMNRLLVSRLADLHFVPTRTALNNLLKEKVRRDEIFVTGNTVIDALLEICKRNLELKKIPFKLNQGEKLLLVTAHRRESFGPPLKQISMAIADLAKEFKKEIRVVIPVHKNPKVRATMHKILGGLSNIILLEPLSYEIFAQLMRRSYLILTDSGGIQEEAPSLGKPVLVLREKTERPEALLAKTVKLVGINREDIYREARKLLLNKKEYNKMARAVNPYGDGQAVKRIVGILLYYFGFTTKLPREFNPKS